MRIPNGRWDREQPAAIFTSAGRYYGFKVAFDIALEPVTKRFATTEKGYTLRLPCLRLYIPVLQSGAVLSELATMALLAGRRRQPVLGL